MSATSSKKKKLAIIIIVLVLLIGAAAGGFYFWNSEKNSSNEDQTNSNQEPKEISTDSVLTYVDTNEDLSSFKEYMTGYDVSVKVVESNSKLTTGKVSLVIIAPSNEAFQSDEAKQLESVPAELSNDLRGYYYAIFNPNADGTAPDLTLDDGERITMFNGRDLTFKKVGNRVTVVDAKGRKAKVSSQYVVDKDGNRIYFIDNILLLQ